MTGLQELAMELGISDRTLRRGAATGWVKIVRPGIRTWWLFGDEAAWLKGAWPTLAPLRAELRVMPELRLVVLYGPAARCGASHDEPLDLLASLADERRIFTITRRLREACGREVRLCSLRSAREQHLDVLVEALRFGRALRDPGGEWPALLQRRRAVAALSRAGRPVLAQGAR